MVVSSDFESTVWLWERERTVESLASTEYPILILNMATEEIRPGGLAGISILLNVPEAAVRLLASILLGKEIITHIYLIFKISCDQG